MATGGHRNSPLRVRGERRDRRNGDSDRTDSVVGAGVRSFNDKKYGDKNVRIYGPRSGLTRALAGLLRSLA